MKRLFLLDAYALIYRAYYAFIKNPRINSKGLNTSAIYGFVTTLEEVLNKEQPTHIAVAFDPQGHRIGYGGGFYDRFLAREPNHPTVALCYDFQMLPELETEEFDIPVDCVLWA